METHPLFAQPAFRKKKLGNCAVFAFPENHYSLRTSPMSTFSSALKSQNSSRSFALSDRKHSLQKGLNLRSTRQFKSSSSQKSAFGVGTYTKTTAFPGTTKDDLNVRSGPGTNYGIVGRIPRGTSRTFDAWDTGTSIFDAQADAYDTRWFKLQGSNSWVSSAYIADNPPSASPQNKVDFSGTIIPTDYLNIRSGPSTSFDKIGNYQNRGGKQLFFDGWQDGQSISNNTKWYHIKNSSGWVSGSLINGSPSSGGSSGTTGQPNFSSRSYRQDNIFWNAGYAPKSVSPPVMRLPNRNALGNCTWYAHGRLKELGYSSKKLNNLSKNANQWDDQARAVGIPLSKKPKVGAIAEWESNHVAVVEKVNANGTITISESSYSATSGNTLDFFYRTRDINPSSVSNFIYV
jgi:surface antigen/uncharacterized protein YraI